MRRRIFMVTGLVLLTISLLAVSAGSAFAAPPDGKPGADPANFEKRVFIHYPKEIPAKGGNPGPPGGGNGGGGGDKDGGGKAWYKYSGIHWASTDVSFQVNAPSDNFLNGIINSFQTWEDDPNSNIDFVYDPEPLLDDVPSSIIGDGSMNGHNEVGWADISAAYPNAIAVTITWYNIFTGEIAEVDMVMNAGLPWSQTDIAPGVDPDTVTGDPDSYDVQNIATHEAGHWLLLEDLYNKPATEQTMYGYGSKGELKKRSLESGDLAGIQAIYP